MTVVAFVFVVVVFVFVFVWASVLVAVIMAIFVCADGVGQLGTFESINLVSCRSFSYSLCVNVAANNQKQTPLQGCDSNMKMFWVSCGL